MVDHGENKLLSNKVVVSRDYGLCKKAVDEKMLLLEEYMYKYNEIQPPRITPSYEIKYEMFTNNTSDKVGNYVAKRVDLLMKVDEFYKSLTEILKKLSKEELVYFNSTYLYGLSEPVICEKLHIAISTLRRIKESCIIKIAMHFDIDVKVAS